MIGIGTVALGLVLVSSAILFIFILKLLFTSKVNGNWNYVNQQNCVSGGDLVGGDLVKSSGEKSTRCKYCGSHQ